MQKNHKVRINVSSGLERQHVLTSRRGQIAARLVRILFGGYSEVLVLSPGKTVSGIEIREMEEGDEK